MQSPIPNRPSRRGFLHLSAGAAGAAFATSLTASPLAGNLISAMRQNNDPPQRKLDILILGGTGQTGPFQVRYALQRGHKVTVFNRGRRSGELPPEVEQLRGDRNAAELDALRGDRRWDVVIDNPTTLPFWVRDVGEILKDRTDHYLFISTLSVYASNAEPDMDEDAPLAEYTGDDPLEETMESFRRSPGQLYGQLKAASERESQKWFGDRTTIIRPGLIVGPRDETDRFTYWPMRLHRGGEVLAPGTPDDPVQFIDGRDLAQWTIRMAEQRTTGVFNAIGPRSTLGVGAMLNGIRASQSGDIPIKLTWVPADFLSRHQVQPWGHMPVWVPPGPQSSGFGRRSNRRAVDAGLTFRPLAETARDTREWFLALPEERQAELRAGLGAEREREVLAAWHEEQGTEAE